MQDRIAGLDEAEPMEDEKQSGTPTLEAKQAFDWSKWTKIVGSELTVSEYAYNTLPFERFPVQQLTQFVDELPGYLKSKPEITAFSLEGMQNSTVAQAICKELLNSPQITSLEFSCCYIGVYTEELMHLIAKNKNIQSLKMGSNTPKTFNDKFSMVLAQSDSITHLFFDWITLTDISVFHFITKLKLHTLAASGESLSAKTLGAVVEHKFLTNLNLSGSTMAAGGFEKFTAGLLFNTTLKWLSLRNCKLAPNQLKALAKAIDLNQSIERLSISGNKCQDSFFSCFTPVLEKNKSLVQLSMCESKVSDHNATFLANALKSNKTLRSLYLDRNNIRNRGAMALAGLENIIDLGAHTNPIGVKGKAALLKNKVFRSLSLPVTQAKKMNVKLTESELKEAHAELSSQVPNHRLRQVLHTQKSLIACGFYNNHSLLHFYTDHDTPQSCLQHLEKNRKEFVKSKIPWLASMFSGIRFATGHDKMTEALLPIMLGYIGFEELDKLDWPLEDKDSVLPASHVALKKSKTEVVGGSLSFTHSMSSSSSSSTITQQVVAETPSHLGKRKRDV